VWRVVLRFSSLLSDEFSGGDWFGEALEEKDKQSLHDPISFH